MRLYWSSLWGRRFQHRRVDVSTAPPYYNDLVKTRIFPSMLHSAMDVTHSPSRPLFEIASRMETSPTTLLLQHRLQHEKSTCPQTREKGENSHQTPPTPSHRYGSCISHSTPRKSLHPYGRRQPLFKATNKPLINPASYREKRKDGITRWEGRRSSLLFIGKQTLMKSGKR